MQAVELKHTQLHFPAGLIDTVANIMTLVRTVVVSFYRRSCVKTLTRY